MEATRTLTKPCAREGCRWFVDPSSVDRCRRHLLLDQGWHVTYGPDGKERWWRYGRRYTLAGAWRKQREAGWGDRASRG